MRYISIGDRTPDTAWLAKANGLLAELKAAKDLAGRKKIIDENGTIWGELKQWLLDISHGKCWFSEAKDCFSHWDVEHYRPKKSAKDLDGTEHTGYWWLAFDWRNYRICGNAGNRKKGTYFPLRPGNPRVDENGDIRFEEPILLDPVDEDDPGLLFFNVEGRAIPAPHVGDQWERHRVEYSVERFNLDFPPLMDKRRLLWAECWNGIQEYLRELAIYQQSSGNVIAKDRMKRVLQRLRKLIREDQELSAVARACIESTGDPRVAGLLRTA